MATPDGTIESLVMQQGGCNAIATFMTCMNRLFSSYIGVFMDVYLDDNVIYTDNLKEHVRCVKLVIDILRQEKFYLAKNKLFFLPVELKLLGHIITREGIRMDPHKVETVLAWKTPTNRDLLRGFLGSVGYLADNVEGIRIPMDVLSRLTGNTVSFRWGDVEGQAFQTVKEMVHDHRDKHRVAMVYTKDAEKVNLVTDACITGVAGKISQGADWLTGPTIAFYSAKLSPAQQNYAVHEVKMLAGLETMMQYRDLLLGVRFTWYTGHKGLEYLMNQKNLTGRQARWISKMSEFDFTIEYVPGKANTVADALSRMYSANEPGTVRAESKYVQHGGAVVMLCTAALAMPIEVGREARYNLRQRAPKVIVPDPAPVKPKASAPLRKVSFDPSRSKQAAPRQMQPTRSIMWKPEAPAKSGRPETGKEFAKRIKKVVLKVGERPEGGPAPTTRDNSESGGHSGSQDANIGTKSNSDNDTIIPELRPNEAFADLGSSGSDPTSLVSIIPMDGIDFTSCIRSQYKQDKFFKMVIEQPTVYRNFEVVDGLVFIVEGGSKRLCIPACTINGRSARELVISHGHSILSHLGIQKTLDYLRDQVWWKSMVADVTAYIDSCSTCRRSKPNNQKPYGLLNPLAVPGVVTNRRPRLAATTIIQRCSSNEPARSPVRRRDCPDSSLVDPEDNVSKQGKVS
jgi:hypothetical protein